MLKQRVLTALVLAPLIIALTLFLPTPVFGVVVVSIFALGAWEWAGLCGFSAVARKAYTFFLVAVLAVLHRVLLADAAIAFAIIAAGLLWWFAAFFQVIRFPAGSGFWRDGRTARAIAGVLILVPAVAGLVFLHSVERSLALTVMVLVSFADIGAYFAGRSFGRHKLAPQVSPGKTWEGLAGALLLTLAIGWAALATLSLPDGLGAWFMLLCLATVLASVLGDLVESMFKRLVGAKDSGNLLPGHGGVLDRVDSITAAAPVFAAGIYLLKVSA